MGQSAAGSPAKLTARRSLFDPPPASNPGEGHALFRVHEPLTTSDPVRRLDRANHPQRPLPLELTDVGEEPLLIPD